MWSDLGTFGILEMQGKSGSPVGIFSIHVRSINLGCAPVSRRTQNINRRPRTSNFRESVSEEPPSQPEREQLLNGYLAEVQEVHVHCDIAGAEAERFSYNCCPKAEQIYFFKIQLGENCSRRALGQ